MQNDASTAGGGRVPPRLTRSLSAMTQLLLSDETVDAVLQLMVALAQSTMDSVDGASVSLFRTNQFETQGATTEDVREADRVQHETGQGPCITATTEGRPVNVEVRDDDPRWPAFARVIGDRNFTGVLSTPLSVKEQRIGALNLYSRSTGPFDEADEQTAQIFADQAAVVLANAAAFASVELANHHLNEALLTRDIIGMAKGVVVADQGCSADEAFDILRRASQRENRKLRDVARDVVQARQAAATRSD